MQRAQHSVTMMFVSGLVGVLLVVTAQARLANFHEEHLCSVTPQCLMFEKVCATKDYTVRKYDSVFTAAVAETSTHLESAVSDGFMRLRNYMDGANEEGMTMEFAPPLLVKVNHTKSGGLEEFKVYFLLPFEFQDNPPEPTDPRVYVSLSPKITVYAGSYDGLLSDESDKTAADNLAAALDLAEAAYAKGFHLSVLYESPSPGSETYREVFFYATGDPVCASGAPTG